jgi:hypothetical protein
MLHRHSQNADHDFRTWPDKDVVFASLLDIVDALQSTSQDVYARCDGSMKRGQIEEAQFTSCYTAFFF